jgi:sigma-B regulation protein RsbU (phosphoserine phosphatase)
MELDTNSWGETTMMVFTEKRLDIRRSTLASHFASAAIGATDITAAQPFSVATSDAAQEALRLRDELDAVRRDHAKLSQAIYEAAQIQRKLCAPREMSWGKFEIAGEIFPVRHLSGDFFKVMELGSALGVVLGDIAGKGMTAGIWQAHLMGLIQRSARHHSNPGEAIAEVNRELCGDEGVPPLTALFFARIESRTNELVYCNAGLPAPLLLRDNKSLERLDEGGPMLGAVKNGAFQTGRVTLNPGDLLVAYSDGVTECRNAEDQEFEMDRLTAATKAVSGISANKALFSLLGTVLDFADSCSPNDDLTVLVVRCLDALNKKQSRRHTKDFSAPERRTTSTAKSRSKHSGRGGQSSR